MLRRRIFCAVIRFIAASAMGPTEIGLGRCGSDPKSKGGGWSGAYRARRGCCQLFLLRICPFAPRSSSRSDEEVDVSVEERVICPGLGASGASELVELDLDDRASAKLGPCRVPLKVMHFA
jgi:hypothetical protein